MEVIPLANLTIHKALSKNNGELFRIGLAVCDTMQSEDGGSRLI